MKTEHFEAIERAKMHGVMPSVLAHELLVRDLVEAAMFEWQNIAAPFSKLNEGQRQEVTDRVTEKVTKSVYTAVGIISSRSVDTIPLTVHNADFKQSAIKITATIDAKDPNRHGLIDVAGKLCLLVLAPNDYAEGLDSLQVERDQREMPLHVSDLTGSLFEQPAQIGTKEELAAHVAAGNPSATDDSNPGKHEFAEVGEPLGKEFGDYDYEDAASIVVLHGTVIDVAWLQRRLAVSSDQATTLLLRLVDNDVITIETEAENSIDNTYTVVGKLDDVVNVE